MAFINWKPEEREMKPNCLSAAHLEQCPAERPHTAAREPQKAHAIRGRQQEPPHKAPVVQRRLAEVKRQSPVRAAERAIGHRPAKQEVGSAPPPPPKLQCPMVENGVMVQLGGDSTPK